MNAPTLIVGLGGTGSKVALKVADQVHDQLDQKVFQESVFPLAAVHSFHFHSPSFMLVSSVRGLFPLL